MITYDQVKSELLELAEAFPEKIYERPDNATSCLYVHTYTLKGEVGQVPGCIVGWWLNRYHGISLDTLAQFNDAPSYSLTVLLNKKGRLDGLHFRAQDLVDRTQTFQDGGMSWGEAVSQAIIYTEGRPQ